MPDPATDRLADLIRVGQGLDRHVRYLHIICARCDLTVLRVERDKRDRQAPTSPHGATFTLGGLHVRADGARNFQAFRPEPTGLDRTYSWTCAHGHADSRRLERFLRAWPQHETATGGRRVVRIKLGRDL